ncbi:MAG TPA: hypothetical protein VKR29_12120 [Candidatus Binataceae bacterium]|nr:hypothetical protein [Candidatus Binataceae bacterium]
MRGRVFPAVALAALLLSLHGCFGSYYTHGDNDVAVGEEHEVNFPDDQTFVMTQDVLRGHGVLFDVKPEHQIVTYWKPADQPVGTMSSLAGNVAQYRYEVQVVPEGSRRSKIIANVRVENVPQDQVDTYKASRRLNLFNDFDQLAANLPPPPLTPGSGGVNFALLPGEDLAALSKRVTGNPDNWPQIAKDNGLKSVSDTAGVQSVWIANSLMPKHGAGASHPNGEH